MRPSSSRGIVSVEGVRVKHRVLLFVAAFVVIVVGIPVGILTFGLFQEAACPSGDGSPVPVLVAKRLIPKGTSGAVIAKRGMYAATVLPCGETKPGAIADPTYLAGRVAAVDLFPGQQLTEADFAST